MKTLRASDEVRSRYLATISLFQSLTEQERKLFAAEALLKSYDKSEVLFRMGQSAAELMCLVRGSVRIFRLTPEGKEKPALQAWSSLVTRARRNGSSR